MRKNKFIYTLSALMMACIISFSGVGGSYIQAKATSGAFDALWNTEATAIENIGRHMLLWAHAAGVFLSPSLTSGGMFLLNASDFYDFMISDGYSEEEANEVCHGGGGHVRDGISVDDDGNVTYSDEVSDLFHDYIVEVLETNCGYYYHYIYPISTVVDNFSSSETYDAVCNYLSEYNFIYGVTFSAGSWVGVNFDLKTCGDLYPSSYDNYFVDAGDDQFILYDDSWSQLTMYDKAYVLTDGSFELVKTNTSKTYYLDFSKLYCLDGMYIKVFDSLSALKNHLVGNQPYYVTQNWLNYNPSIDNSVTITEQQYEYFTDNSTILYETVQNNITNSSEIITDQSVQIIVNNTYNYFIEESTNSGSDDSGNGGDDDSGGTGISDLFEGIGKIFDTILSLIGKLMGVVADFTQSILDLFSGFTTFTDGFSDFLAGAFGFIPAEIWNVIQVGLSLMVLAAIIKFLRK